jgi:hypothetical protein
LKRLAKMKKHGKKTAPIAVSFIDLIGAIVKDAKSKDIRKATER